MASLMAAAPPALMGMKRHGCHNHDGGAPQREKYGWLAGRGSGPSPA